MKEFKSLPLREELIKNLGDLGYHEMTPIQSKTLPVTLEGKDIIAQAKTGSGKTAAFALKILNSLDLEESNIQSLILCPTRELAEQVASEVRKLARQINNIKVLTLCGGVAENHQEKSLSHGANIVVGTPGRILRLLNKESLNLRMIRHLVLDEADRMLDMGFYNDIMDINFFLPPDRQTLLFSATFPEEIKELSKTIQKDAIQLKVDFEQSKVDIDQYFYQVESHTEKTDALLKVLGEFQPESFIVFCKTKQITDSVANALKKKDIYVAAIHGDLEQNERTAILTKFSNKSLSGLIATDVAARGLDIQDLSAVINLDLPNDPEVYVHRIGRTGRAGKKGQAISFFIKKNRSKLDAIEDFTSQKCEEASIEQLSNSPYLQQPPMRTMYVGGGKKNKLRPGDILGALVNEAKLDPKDVGDIKIMNIISYVAVIEDKIEIAVRMLSEGKIKNRKFKVGLA